MSMTWLDLFFFVADFIFVAKFLWDLTRSCNIWEAYLIVNMKAT